MTTETGNAQSEVADPSQPYGLARWLASEPLFAETKTPTATYQRQSGGAIGQVGLVDQANSGLLPWLDNLPEKDSSTRERSIGDGAATMGGDSSAPAFARTGGGLGSILGDVGSVAGAAMRTTGLGALGTFAGTGKDQMNANKSLSRLGAENLGFMDYIGSVIGNMLPGPISNALNIRDTNQRLLDKLDLAGRFDAWTQSDIEEGMRMQGILDSLTYSAPQAGPSPQENISYTYPSDSEMNAPGATGGPTGGWTDEDGGYGESEGGGWGGGGGYNDDGSEAEQN